MGGGRGGRRGGEKGERVTWVRVRALVKGEGR